MFSFEGQYEVLSIFRLLRREWRSTGGSGPFGSDYFDHPWMFDAYVPDVIVSKQ